MRYVHNAYFFYNLILFYLYVLLCSSAFEAPREHATAILSGALPTSAYLSVYMRLLYASAHNCFSTHALEFNVESTSGKVSSVNALDNTAQIPVSLSSENSTNANNTWD